MTGNRHKEGDQDDAGVNHNEIKPRCHCGSTDIEHAYGEKWQCENCGRFHGPKAMDRMTNAARSRTKAEPRKVEGSA